MTHRRRAARTVVLALIAAAAAPRGARAQVSPGPLARPHANLDDNASCFRCHGRGSDSMDRQCVACHDEIAWSIEAGRGLHGRENLAECSTCHPDHGGRDFALIDWGAGGTAGFDHRRAGWPLEGKHGQLKCEQCHKAELQRGEVLAKRKRRNADRSWLGLEPSCAGCHTDVHAGALGPACERCHDNLAWKPAPEFDHARSGFALTGKHIEVPCAKCHFVPDRIFAEGPGGTQVARYKPLDHSECSACHRDVHEGRLGPKCVACHVTESFRNVGPEGFDHARTRFPLRGAHAKVDCAKCHDERTAWGKRPRFETCNACHRDAHAGTATLRGKVVDCAACHDERAFRPATYRVQDHATSSYPLEGRHATVACDRCHVKQPGEAARATLGPAGVLLRPSHAACRSCHDDAHGNQLTERPQQGACESCHRVEGWRPSTYGVKEHATTRLPLAGRHAEAACASCHGPERKDLPALAPGQAPGRARVALTTLSPECTSCHHDPHAGEFSAGGSRPRPGGCRGCHGFNAFRPASIDPTVHDTFTYPLAGGHRAVPCEDCHAELSRPPSDVRLLRVSGTARPLRFQERFEQCADCHRSPHGDQFHDRPGGERCEACHGVETFRPASGFDHDRDARFVLRGGHRDVPCQRCHPSRPTDDGRQQVVYRPLSVECRDCHGRQIPKPPASESR